MADWTGIDAFALDLKRPDPWIGLVALLLVIGLMAPILPSLGSGPSVPFEDEGFRLYVTWRMSLGELPYRDFFDNQFPNLHLAAAPLVKLFGRRVDAPRLFVVAFFFVLVGGLIGASRRFQNRLAPGALAALLLMFIPVFRRVVVQFRPDVPSLVLGLLAVVGLFWSGPDRESGRTNVLSVAGGVVFGLACFVKPTPLYWLPGLAAAWWLSRPSGTDRRVPFGFVAGAAGSLLVQAGIWHGLSDGAVWEQVVAANRVPVPGTPPLEVVSNWTLQNAVLLPGLLLWGFTQRKRFSTSLFVAGALGLASYPVVPPNTPYPRHLLFVSVAWAYPAGVGYSRWWLWGVRSGSRPGRWVTHLLAGLVLAGGVMGVGARPSHGAYPLREADWIRTHTRPGEVVLTDYGGLNYLAGRPRPPSLANVSANLTMGGVVTADDVRRAVAQSRPAMIYLHVYPDAWHLANVRGMDAVVAAWVENFHYRGLRIAGGRVNMVFTAEGRPLPGLHRDPRESLAALEPVFSTYEWDRTLRALRERVSS